MIYYAILENPKAAILFRASVTLAIPWVVLMNSDIVALKACWIFITLPTAYIALSNKSIPPPVAC